MKQEDIDLLKQGFDSANQTKEEFLNFKLETRSILLGQQLQLFQSLSAIVLAFWAIAITKGLFALDLWSLISIGASGVLVCYAPSYVKEFIDKEDQDLRNTEEHLEKMKAEVYAKIQEAIQKNDIQVWTTFVRDGARIKEKEELGYASEIILLLFMLSLSFAMAAILQTHLGMWNQHRTFITLLLVVVSILYAFGKWSVPLTNWISKCLNRFFN